MLTFKYKAIQLVIMINQKRADKLYSQSYQQQIKEIIPKWYNQFIDTISIKTLNDYMGIKVYNILKSSLTESQFKKLNDQSKYKYENLIVKVYNILHDSNFAFSEYVDDKLKSKNYTSDILIEKILMEIL